MVKVEAYCNEWNTDNYPGIFFCFLRGGLTASKCPGARKMGSIYWTKDPTVCIENEGPEVGKYRDEHHVFQSDAQP